MENQLVSWDHIPALLRSAREAGINVYLSGPSSCSKTFSAHASAETVFSVTITREMDSSQLTGYDMPGRGWTPGPVVRAMQSGSPLVLNELGLANGDVEAVCLMACDSPQSIRYTIPSTGETIRPTAGYHVIATANAPLATLSAALVDRFVEVQILGPHPTAYQGLPADLRSAAEAAWLAEPARRRSLRDFLRFAALRDPMGPLTAAQIVFGPGFQAVLDSLKVASDVQS